jgi:hypothetical protein
MTSKGIHSSQRSFSASRPRRWASARPATHSVAVAKRTRCPARQALIPSVIAPCVLPVPGAEQDDVFLRLQEVELAHSERARIKLSGQTRDEDGNEVVRLGNLGTQNHW